MTLGRVQYRFESAAFPGETFDVVRAHVREALDAPFEAEVEVRIPRPDEEGLTALGQSATLTLTREEGGERRFVGVATEVEIADTLDLSATHVLLRLEPALALLGLGQRSRIFQDKTVAEILEEVLADGLGAYGREAELALDGTYPTREYCVQYRESDYAFVERLMEEEGISYAFDHAGDAERMVLRDRNSFPAASIAGSSVPFLPGTGRTLGADEPIYVVAGAARPTTHEISIRDHDWTAPAAPKAGHAGEAPRESYEFGHGRSLTLSDYAGTAYGADDGDRLAALRLERAQREAMVLEGVSRVIGFTAGTTFLLTGHPELSGEYLLIEVEHASVTPEGSDAPDPYQNHFRAIPKDTPWRPARTRPKPRVPSVQTAIVTGPSGEEIFTDEHGRVKVQFHWDLEGANDDKSSCFLRVQQAWAGSAWGFVFIPRIGMEVVVHFVHGDPDRPVVHGSVYNSEHRPPYPLPGEKTKSTIKSASSPGEAGFNELRFEDLKGDEQIFLHAQKNLDEVVLNDHTTQVGNDQTNKVGNNQTQIIVGHQTETVDVDQKMTVDLNRDVDVTKKFTEIILAGEKRTVVGAESETISGGETRVIIGKLEEHFKATETRMIVGGQTEIVLGGVEHTIASGHAEGVAGMINQVNLGAYTLSSTGGTTLIEAASLNNVIALGGMSVSAAAITVDCTLRVKIDPVWFNMDVTSKSSGGVSLTIAAVNVGVSVLSQSANIGSIALTGASIAAFGAKATATGISVTFGSGITEVKAANNCLGFRLKFN